MNQGYAVIREPAPTSFNTAYYQVNVNRSKDTHYILPFGDVHWDNDNCCHERFNAWCEWASKKPRALFIGMGDMLDMVSSKERIILGKASNELHEQSVSNFDKLMRKTVKDFAKKVSFMKGRTLGMIEGNHYYRFADGTTSTQYLCQELGCKYLGAFGIIGVSFKYNGAKRILYIVAFHGIGVSSTLGGSVNQVVKLAQTVSADIYISAHDHQKFSVPDERLVPTPAPNSDRLVVNHKKILYVRAGSFLRGYVEGQPSYVAQRGLRPSSLGTVKIEITPIKHDSSYDLDIHASV